MIFFVHTSELLRILMTASSATARLLSVVVLLLSLAPLGSLYVLFYSAMTSCSSNNLVVDNNHLVVSKEAGELTLSRVLQDPNASLEELWIAVFVNHWNNNPQQQQAFYPLTAAAAATTTTTSTTTTTTFASLFPIRQAAAQHFSLVLPWIISLLLGVILSLVSFLWGQQRRHWQSLDYYRQRTAERRRCRVLRKLQAFTKQLQPQDCVMVRSTMTTTTTTTGSPTTTLQWKIPCPGVSLDNSSSTSSSTVEESHGDDDTVGGGCQPWRLPRPRCCFQQTTTSTLSSKSQSTSTSQQQRLVEESCAICLHPYALHETVVWSPNRACIHCFHQDCVVPWLVSRPSKQQLCPCCRQPFVRPGAWGHAHAS